MEPQQKYLVKETFEQIRPISDKAAALFYQRLFEIAPEVQPLFKSDMESQGVKLMQTLDVAVSNLDNLDMIMSAVQDLGKRHVRYGVDPADYEKVGEALLWTLEQGLGPTFTPQVKEAWSAVYTTLAGVMKEAAYG